jgi:hypothetical protein
MTTNKRVSKTLTGDQAFGVISNFGPIVPTELRMADEDLPISASPVSYGILSSGIRLPAGCASWGDVPQYRE